LNSGDIIRELRKGKRLSYRELADKANVSHTFVSEWEKGNIPSLLDKAESVVKNLDLSRWDEIKTLLEKEIKNLNEQRLKQDYETSKSILDQQISDEQIQDDIKLLQQFQVVDVNFREFAGKLSRNDIHIVAEVIRKRKTQKDEH